MKMRQIESVKRKQLFYIVIQIVTQHLDFVRQRLKSGFRKEIIRAIANILNFNSNTKFLMNKPKAPNSTAFRVCSNDTFLAVPINATLDWGEYTLLHLHYHPPPTITITTTIKIRNNSENVLLNSNVGRCLCLDEAHSWIEISSVHFVIALIVLFVRFTTRQTTLAWITKLATFSP